MTRQCKNGVWLAVRSASDVEEKHVKSAPRHVAQIWESVEAMLEEVKLQLPEFYPQLKVSINNQAEPIDTR